MQRGSMHSEGKCAWRVFLPNNKHMCEQPYSPDKTEISPAWKLENATGACLLAIMAGMILSVHENYGLSHAVLTTA
jgi:hypothetical protein